MQYSTPSDRSRSRIPSSVARSYCGVGTARIYSAGVKGALGRPLTMDEVGEAAAAGAVAVLPVGATEQHGPHLATGTDTLLAAQVAEAAAERTGDVVLPALALRLLARSHRPLAGHALAASRRR